MLLRSANIFINDARNSKGLQQCSSILELILEKDQCMKMWCYNMTELTDNLPLSNIEQKTYFIYI